MNQSTSMKMYLIKVVIKLTLFLKAHHCLPLVERKTNSFNSPYNQNISTNIAKILLKLMYEHFPRYH